MTAKLSSQLGKDSCIVLEPADVSELNKTYLKKIWHDLKGFPESFPEGFPEGSPGGFPESLIKHSVAACR